MKEGYFSSLPLPEFPLWKKAVEGRPDFLKTCPSCLDIGFCQWCPALAYLESGKMDVPVEFFCGTAWARADALRDK